MRTPLMAARCCMMTRALHTVGQDAYGYVDSIFFFKYKVFGN